MRRFELAPVLKTNEPEDATGEGSRAARAPLLPLSTSLAKRARPPRLLNPGGKGRGAGAHRPGEASRVEACRHVAAVTCNVGQVQN